MTQLPFTFNHRPALDGEDFLVASSNAEAVKWVEQWPNWTSVALVIVGPKHSGKTHLSNVFLAQSGAGILSLDQLRSAGADQAIRNQKALVIEDIEAFLQEGLEEELFHLYNLAAEFGVKILITALSPPPRWGVKLKDLSSRMNTSLVAEIKSPDDTLLSALIVKQFSDRQLTVNPDVLVYMVSRMDRSFAGVGRLIAAIDRDALAEKRKITVPLVRSVLEKMKA